MNEDLNKPLSDTLLQQLSKRIAEQMGLHFPPDRWDKLEAGIRSAANKLSVLNLTSWAHSLLSVSLTRHQIQILAGELTIGETYFLREKRSFEILGNYILPELIRVRRGNTQRLRIWSAGCCTGEEPYSIAMLVDRLLPELSNWQVTILATDINPQFLLKATTGIFSEWSFRNTPSWVKKDYFQPLPGSRFALSPRIKELVTFAYLNLGTDTYPSLENNTNAMDVIFCRNVLMYFTPEQTHRVVRNLHKALVETGWLAVSPVEISQERFSKFVTTPFDGAVFYRKLSAAAPMLASYPEFSSTEVDEPIAASILLHSALVSATSSLSTQFESGVSVAAGELSAVCQAPTLFDEALALFKLGQYFEAARKLEANPDAANDVEGCVLLARIYANLGKLIDARRWIETAIAADKSNAASHYLQAMILQEQNAIEEAFAALKRTLYLEPDFILAHFALGNLERRQGKHHIAERHFRNALALLNKCDDATLLPYSDGLAAAQLKEMIQSITAGAAA